MTSSGLANSLDQLSAGRTRVARLLRCGLLTGATLIVAGNALATDNDLTDNGPTDPGPGTTAEAVPEIMTLDEATGVTDALGSDKYRALEQQIDAGELRRTRLELQRDIADLQRTGDRYDGALVEPLRLLGRIYHEEGEYPAAAETLALATQISRIANGLHSAEQLQLVHQEISSLRAMGNVVEANRRHEYAFSIARRHYGRFSEQLVPELLKIGLWYTSTGDVVGARDRFSEARLLLSAKPETAESEDMIFALRGIARSYRDEAFPPFHRRSNKETEKLYERNGLTERQSDIREEMVMRASINSFHRGSEALIDVVRIEVNRLADIQDQMSQTLLAAANESDQPPADETESAAPDGAAGPAKTSAEGFVTTNARRRTASLNLSELAPVIDSPDVDKTALITSILELADWYLLMNKEARAFAFYQHAYQLAQRDPNTDAVALFAEPTLLYFPRPRDPKIPEAAPPESFEKGFVELTYDVDHRGAIKRLKTLNSEPRGMMDFNVRSSARIARYRPRIVDGLPQPALAQVYKYKFDYFPKNRSKVPPRVIDTDVATSTEAAGSGG